MRKQIRFIVINTLAWCFAGALCWFIAGDRFIENKYMALYFIGYPGFFLGIIGGFIYIWNHDD